MLNTRSLICSANRSASRSWALTLEALGSRTDLAERFPAAAPAVDLVVGDLSGATGSPPPLRAGGHGLMIVPKPELAAAVRLLGHPGIDAVAVTDYLDERLLTYAAARLLQGDIFGISKVLSWGAQVSSLLVNSHEERLQALAMTHGFVRALGLRGRHGDAVELVADELLMNALYNAPVAGAVSLHANVAPRDRAGLQLERPAILQIAADGRRLALSVRDSYGSLSRETILQVLERCLREGGQIERKTSGAGLGLYMVANNVTEFIANLLPGTATEIVCVFALDAPGQQLKHFGIYQETFARGAEIEAPASRGAPVGVLPRKRPPSWSVMALALAVLVLVGAGLFALWPALTRPGRGAIQVSVSPPGSAVYVNGVRRGTASPTLVVPDLEASGSYLVSARQAGYQNAEELVGVASGKTQEVKLILRQRRAKAHVASVPAGAEVWVNGRQTGLRTPATLENLEPDRKLEIRFTRYGYVPGRGEFIPRADEVVRLQTSLSPAPEFSLLTVSSTPEGARLLVNDVDTGLTTPIQEHPLRGGQSYRLELRLAGRVPWELNVDPRPGQRLSQTAPLEPGETLSVKANVPGRAVVSGIGRPLPFERVMPYGTHRVRLRGDRPYLDHAFVVTLKQGKPVVQSLQFGVVSAPPQLRILVDRTRVPKLALLPGDHSVKLIDPKSGETRSVTVKVTAGQERVAE